ncbi:hypothetical protein [Brenneria izadpanahii]|uniref:hypothetical protein n=1 Tax=Brenneria izadpanahii TaxID=2722756 RepID=UPI001AAF308F|nr:hypothetical protein [Brenneria izadpanahii]
MKNTILIYYGYGSGIGHAAARRFGKAGHPVVLTAGNAQRPLATVSETVSHV